MTGGTAKQDQGKLRERLARLSPSERHRLLAQLGMAGEPEPETSGPDRPVSVGLVGNCAEVVPALLERGVIPDIVTDQTSAHDPLNGYLPQGWSVAQWRARAETDPGAVERAARASMKVQVAAMVAFHDDGVPTVDYGNNIRQMALEEGLERAFAFPGFVPAYIRPLFCRGIGPFRWAALSGDPETIRQAAALRYDTILVDGDHSYDGVTADIDNYGGRVDKVLGDAGNDVVSGGASDDTVRGNAGNDTLLGGLGADFMAHRGRRESTRRSRLCHGDRSKVLQLMPHERIRMAKATE